MFKTLTHYVSVLKIIVSFYKDFLFTSARVCTCLKLRVGCDISRYAEKKVAWTFYVMSLKYCTINISQKYYYFYRIFQKISNIQNQGIFIGEKLYPQRIFISINNRLCLFHLKEIQTNLVKCLYKLFPKSKSKTNWWVHIFSSQILISPGFLKNFEWRNEPWRCMTRQQNANFFHLSFGKTNSSISFDRGKIIKEIIILLRSEME